MYNLWNSKDYKDNIKKNIFIDPNSLSKDNKEGSIMELIPLFNIKNWDIL